MVKNPEKKNPAKLIKYLEDRGVIPKILEHKRAYTAIDAANTLKRKMEEIVKTLLVKADQRYYVVCLPANCNLDFKKIKEAIEKSAGVKVKTIQIPNEKIMAGILKLKNEGISAFGGFYKLPVIIEKKLANVKKAVFQTESFFHSVEMSAKNFIKLENAILANFGINKKIKVINKPQPSSSLIKKAANKQMATKKKAKKAKKTVKKAKKTAKKRK